MAKRLFKKGFSPLIATILLIATAVAIGASIMSFGMSFVDAKKFSTQEEALCSKVKLEVIDVDNKQQICYDRPANSVEFTVANKADIGVESLIVWVIGEEVYVADLRENIKPGYPLKKRINYDFSTYGDITQVNLIPKIKDEEKQITCSGSKLVLEYIKPC